jgi:glycosyltransferase involved in cell wall biosynthesis
MLNLRVPRVVFLNPWEKRIGPNRYLVEMLRQAPGLASRAIVVLHEPGDASEEYRQLGCQVLVWQEIAQIRAGRSWSNLLNLMKRHSLDLVRFIRRLNGTPPDLLVSNTEHLLLGDMAARLLGIPHLKIFHSITFSYRLAGRPRLVRAYLRTLTFGSTRIISVSDTQKRALVAGGVAAGKVVTAPNPIPIDNQGCDYLRALPPSLSQRMSNKGPIIVNVGRISPLKGQDQLIAALPRVIEEYPNLLCIFAGQLGSDSGLDNTRDFLQSILGDIQERGIAGNVHFIGNVDYLPALFRRADLYVHTSRMESFCRAIAEALMCSLPVVAFDSGAVPEVAGPGALLVASGDTAALATAITELLGCKEKSEHLAESGRRHVEKFFAAPAVAKHFTELLMQEKGRKRDVRDCRLLQTES